LYTHHICGISGIAGPFNTILVQESICHEADASMEAQEEGSIMSAITRWLDKILYPTYEDKWDNKMFRAFLIEKIKPDYFLLDYGAGRGAFHELNFRGKTKRVAGVDIHESVLHNPFLDESELIFLSSGRIPYDDNTFDLVFSANVMEHIREPEIVFKEIFRVVKPNGLFIAKTPNKLHYVPMIAKITPYSFHIFINKIRGRESYDTFPTVYKCNTVEALKKYSHSSGFKVIDIKMWEGRPEYLRIASLLYLLGYIYERFVNTLPFLAKFRSVMVFTLQKPDVSLEALRQV
jgi:ubiquinone/menaquinone biosynthesis C-methylase UbiE